MVHGMICDCCKKAMPYSQIAGWGRINTIAYDDYYGVGETDEKPIEICPDCLAIVMAKIKG